MALLTDADLKDPQYVQAAFDITQERITQIDQTIVAVEKDLRDAKIRVHLDEIGASVNPDGGGTSNPDVLNQHEERLERLRQAKQVAIDELKQLKTASEKLSAKDAAADKST